MDPVAIDFRTPVRVRVFPAASLAPTHELANIVRVAMNEVGALLFEKQGGQLACVAFVPAGALLTFLQLDRAAKSEESA